MGKLNKETTIHAGRNVFLTMSFVYRTYSIHKTVIWFVCGEPQSLFRSVGDVYNFSFKRYVCIVFFVYIFIYIFECNIFSLLERATFFALVVLKVAIDLRLLDLASEETGSVLYVETRPCANHCQLIDPRWARMFTISELYLLLLSLNYICYYY